MFSVRTPVPCYTHTRENTWLFYIEKTTRLPDVNMGNNAKLGHFYNRKLGVLPNGLFLSILWVSICALLVEGSQRYTSS